MKRETKNHLRKIVRIIDKAERELKTVDFRELGNKGKVLQFLFDAKKELELKLKHTELSEKPKFVKTKPLPPYNEKGKPNFPIRNVPGVYVVLKNGQIIYAGYSHNNLYRTMYHHFQNWNDSTNQYRALWKDLKGIKVYVIYCDSGKVAKLLENAILIKHRPKANVNVYDGFITDEKEDKLLKEAQKAFGINPKDKSDLPF